MMRTMATAAESRKEAEAKLIHAQGNLDSAKIFEMAAAQLEKSPISIQL